MLRTEAVSHWACSGNTYAGSPASCCSPTPLWHLEVHWAAPGSSHLGLRGVTSPPLSSCPRLAGAVLSCCQGPVKAFHPATWLRGTLDSLGPQRAGGLAALCMLKAITLPRGLRAPDLGGHCVSPAVALGPQPFMVEEARPGRVAGTQQSPGRRAAHPTSLCPGPSLAGQRRPGPASARGGAWRTVTRSTGRHAARSWPGPAPGPRRPGVPGEGMPRVSGQGLRPAGHDASHRPPGTEPVTAAPLDFLLLPN